MHGMLQSRFPARDGFTQGYAQKVGGIIICIHSNKARLDRRIPRDEYLVIHPLLGNNIDVGSGLGWAKIGLIYIE